METFGQIAHRTGIAADTIRNRWKRLKAKGTELGTINEGDGARYFTLEESAQFDYPLVEKGVKPTPEIAVENGNHQRSVNLSIAPDSVNMGVFRTDREALSLENSDQFLQSLDGFLSVVENHMDKIESHREQRFNEARNTKNQAAKRIQKVKERASQHRIKTDLMAMLTNSEIDEVEDIVAEFHELTGQQPSNE